MNLKLKKKPRKFKVGSKKNIHIKDLGEVYLNNNEQITFAHKNSRYDFCKKKWGYYATSSINNRLKKSGFRTFLIKNSLKNIFLTVVHKNKIKEFKMYIKKEKNIIINELTNYK